MKHLLMPIFILQYFISYSQITYIPDTNFEQQLINLGLDSDNTINGQVLTTDINTLTVLSIVDNLNILSLVGIQDFVSLETLYCDEINLDSLDLSNNVNLIVFYSRYNYFLKKITLPVSVTKVFILENAVSEINVYDLINLESLDIIYNRVALDSLNLSNCLNLKTLSCINLGLKIIDVSNNPYLTTLYCGNDIEVDWVPCAENDFTSLDLGSNIYLKNLMTTNLPIIELNLTHNQDIEFIYSTLCKNLSNIIFSNNTKLKYLDLNKCNLNEINLYEIPNIELLRLGIPINFFESYNRNTINKLDCSKSKKLKTIYVENIDLHELNLNNNNNDTLSYMNAKNNPNLYCLNVDNEKNANNGIGAYSNWLKDSYIDYSENCVTSIIEHNNLFNTSIYPNPSSGYVNINNTNNLVKDLEITSNTGKIININKTLKKDLIQINLSHLSKGLYFIKLRNHKNRIVSKSVILK